MSTHYSTDVPPTERDRIYEWLGQQLRPIEELLDAQGRITLDGKLWALSDKLVRKGHD